MQEKEWKAESEAAPITSMKLHSDGMAEFAYGKDPWLYKNGFFAMKSLDYVKWAFKKIDDQTFTLFVEPTQKLLLINLSKLIKLNKYEKESFSTISNCILLYPGSLRWGQKSASSVAKQWCELNGKYSKATEGAEKMLQKQLLTNGKTKWKQNIKVMKPL